MKSLVGILCFLVAGWSVNSIAREAEVSLEEHLAAEISKQVDSVNSATDFIDKYSKDHPKEDMQELKNYVRTGAWGEVPKAKAVGKAVAMTFSDGTVIKMEIQDFWKNKFSINGIPLELSNYKTKEAKISYLIRFMQMKVLNKKTKQASFWSLLIPQADAASSTFCKDSILPGTTATCIGVSAAAVSWFVSATASDTAACVSANRNEITACVNNLLGTSQQAGAVRDLANFFAHAPVTQLSITCIGEGGTPDFSINGVLVNKTDGNYYIQQNLADAVPGSDQLPALVKSCCAQSAADPLAGKCEEFVNSHLGDHQERQRTYGPQMLKDDQGKFFDGTR